MFTTISISFEEWSQLIDIAGECNDDEDTIILFEEIRTNNIRRTFSQCTAFREVNISAVSGMASNNSWKQARRLWKSRGNNSCTIIIFWKWNFKSRRKIRPTVRADNPRAVACFLAKRSGGCKKDGLGYSLHIFSILIFDGPEYQKTTTEPNVLSRSNIERQSVTQFDNYS